MAAALTELRDDPGARRRLSAAARATAEAHFSWDARVRAVLAALP
jgi:glycosyltransferase involved in cell wall biosynthesis